MPSTNDSSRNLTWLLQKQYEEVNTTFRSTWDLYLKFYTVFLTFDIAAMAIILGAKGDLQPTVEHKRLIIAVFVLQTILTAITSAMMAIFSNKSRSHLETARQALLIDDGERGRPLPEIPNISLPTALANWAGWANCGAMIAMAILWLKLAS